MINKISSVASAIKPRFDNASQTIGSALNRSKAAGKIQNLFEANGTDNSFCALMTLMITTVIIPRFLTAKNRNPEDKEATKDEIKEVLFRDIQTCTIMLFALKMLNSIIATKVGKNTGLPMTNKPFQKVFESGEKGIKGFQDKACEFIQEPGKKLRIIGKNLLDLVNPTGGVKALENDEFIDNYSDFEDFSQLSKMFKGIDKQGGNSDKVIKNNIIKELLKEYEEKLAKANHEINLGITKQTDKEKAQAIEEIIGQLKALSEEENIAKYFENNAQEFSQKYDKLPDVILNYIKDSGNGIVEGGKRLNGVLRTVALAIESLYLGFGIPALNQRRLEKKYLTGNPKAKELKNIEPKTDSQLIGKKLDTKEARLFEKFI